jgi:hypothetical protein
MSASISQGWIEPTDRAPGAEYWLTRRNADAEPGYGGFNADARKRYRWTGSAWWPADMPWRRGDFDRSVCMHSANGWRIEGPVERQSVDQAEPQRLGDVAEGVLAGLRRKMEGRG